MSAFIDAEGPHEELEAESATRGQAEIASESRSFQSAEDGDRHNLHRTLYVVMHSAAPSQESRLTCPISRARPELFNDKRQLKSYLAVSNPGLSTWAKLNWTRGAVTGYTGATALSTEWQNETLSHWRL
jgi:hypothetical protein